MTSKEALEKLCSKCEEAINKTPTNHKDKNGCLIGCGYDYQQCPFRTISNDYCDEYEQIKSDLEVLDILKRYFKYRKGEITKEEANMSEKDVGKIKEWREN